MFSLRVGPNPNTILDAWTQNGVFHAHGKHQKHQKYLYAWNEISRRSSIIIITLIPLHQRPSSNNKMSDNRNVDEVNREMDDIFLLQWMATVAARPPRCLRWRHNRLDWNAHVQQLIHEGRFANEYRMSPSAHCNLVRLLDPILQRVEWNSCGSESILVEHIIALGMRVLAVQCSMFLSLNYYGILVW